MVLLLVAVDPVVLVDGLERDLHVADLALGEEGENLTTDAAFSLLQVSHAIGVVEGANLHKDQASDSRRRRGDEPLAVAVDLSLGVENQLVAIIVVTAHVLSDDFRHASEEHLGLFDVIEEVGVHSD